MKITALAVLALLTPHHAAAITAPTPYEDIRISRTSLGEGLKAFDEICLANFPDETAFQASVQASPLRFRRVINAYVRTHNRWQSEFASVIYVRQDQRNPIDVLPQCNFDFMIASTVTVDEIVQALDQTLATRLSGTPTKKNLKFGVRWKWRRNGHRFHLDLIRNDQIKSGQIALSLQPN